MSARNYLDAGRLPELTKTPLAPVKENKSILSEAEQIVNGARSVDYGDVKENFKRISGIASAITGKTFTPEDCCTVLMAVKLAREAHRHKRDNLVDLAGYTEILNRLKTS